MRPFLALAATALAVSATASAQAPKPATTFTGDLGFVSASGNTELTTLNLGEKISHTDGKWALSQLAAYVYGETSKKESANQLRLALRADYAMNPRFGAYAAAQFERNSYAGFNRRTDELLGLLWRAIIAPMDSLGVEAGAVFTQQDNVDGSTESFPSGRAAGNYKHLFSKAAYFQQLVEYLPNLKTSGEYRFNSESALVAPISAHIGVKVGYALRYDSAPPPKFGTTDRVFTTGIQLSY